jgi:hypothetical protein
MNLNLFNNENSEFDPASCFNEVVTIKYECNLETLHNQIKDLSYHGLMSFRSAFITYLLEAKVCDSKIGSEKFWERKIKAVQVEFNYVYPTSMSDDAVRKRLIK